jgi:class 3 adenylate cyclase/tetratricopeptide (TPR) repeat protein
LGGTRRAQAILKQLAQKDPTNRETLALLARTYKDQWSTDSHNTAALDSAFEWYKRAFAINPPGYYPGINAASLALLRNDDATAHRLANQVLKICKSKLAAPDPDELYWLRVTLAEALTILGRRADARKAYRSAAATPHVTSRELSSTRRQARLLSKHLYGDSQMFDTCFPVPKLVVFAGHMVDTGDRTVRRFSTGKERSIRLAINKQLDAIGAGIGFSSAACGSDIIFLEAMLDRGATVHVVLPWPKEQFIQTSVAIAEDDNWIARFENVLARAASVRVLGQANVPDSAIGFDYCNLVMVGLARLYARSLDLELVPLVVWDGLPGEPGGAGSFLRYWRAHQLPVRIIPMQFRAPTKTLRTKGASDVAQELDDDSKKRTNSVSRQEIKAILFADVVSYSQLTEKDLPKFVGEFSQRISRLVAESAFPPTNVNTWGDAFFFAFNRVEHAGRFALELRDLVKTTKWADFGLPTELGIRIAVHAGPVYVTFDPVSRQMTYVGAHVVRAARIEPVTHAGEVFVTEEFAALAAAEEAQGFSCDFIGTTKLAKSYGSFRIYSLFPAEEQFSVASKRK